uniref:cytochrome P450 n=1 Tax=Rhodococcus hoagii TaxID=43767 RepID=UPI001EE0260C
MADNHSTYNVVAPTSPAALRRRATSMLAFGQGPHSCAGSWLALAELNTALTILLTRLPGLRL